MKRLSVKSKFVRWLLKGVPLEQLKVGEHSVVLDADKITYGDGSVYPPASSAQGDLLVRGALVWDRLAKIATGKYLKATATTYEGADIAEADIPAHMAKSKLAWTADKLLKGAGVGADPTEIALGLVDTGATVPTSPVTGQLFLHTPTGRKVLLQYDGSAWQPIQSYGTMTVYVDKTDGTDDLNHGTGVDANAFKTIVYALAALPPTVDGQVNIYINGETYTENVRISAKKMRQYSSINFRGTLSETASLTATGGNIGSGSTPAQVNGTFTAGVYNAKLIEFTSGSNNGLKRVVGLTTTTELWLDGAPLNAAPANGDTYKIYDWGTTISGETIIGPGQTGLNFYDIAFTHNTGYTVCLWGFSYAKFYYCKMVSAGAEYALVVGQASGEMFNSLIQVTVAGGHIGLELENCAQFELNGVKILGYGGANGVGIRVMTSSTLGAIRDGSEISGFNQDICLMDKSSGQAWTSSRTSFIHGSNTGIRAESGGGFRVASGFTYGTKLDGTADANGANTSAETTSYSYISA